MQDTRSFAPMYLKTAIVNGVVSQIGQLTPSVTVAGSDTGTAEAALPGPGTSLSGFFQIQICNLSTSWAYVSFGARGSTVAATVAASYPVAPGAVQIVSVDPDVGGVRVIFGTAAATGNVIFTRGEGV